MFAQFTSYSCQTCHCLLRPSQTTNGPPQHPHPNLKTTARSNLSFVPKLKAGEEPDKLHLLLHLEASINSIWHFQSRFSMQLARVTELIHKQNTSAAHFALPLCYLELFHLHSFKVNFYLNFEAQYTLLGTKICAANNCLAKSDIHHFTGLNLNLVSWNCTKMCVKKFLCLSRSHHQICRSKPAESREP